MREMRERARGKKEKKSSFFFFFFFTLKTTTKQDQLTLLLPAPLEAHHAATLRLRFSYPLPDALEGLYRSTWTEEKEEEQGAKSSSSSSTSSSSSVLRAAAVTQFEANSARTAFPCFDEPALRAPFAVSIVADEGLAVVSNMPEASVEVEEEKSSKEEEAARDSRRRRERQKKKNKKASTNAPPFPPPSSSSPRPRRMRHVFEPTPAMPSYLIAVVVGPLGEFFFFFERVEVEVEFEVARRKIQNSLSCSFFSLSLFPSPVAVPGGHLLPPPAGAALPLPPPRTMPPLAGDGNEEGQNLSLPPSEDAFDAAAAAAGLSPWRKPLTASSSSSPSHSSKLLWRPLTLYARPAAAPLLGLAARAARGALAAHERALGTAYALPHLQVIAVPDFSANAMENWGEWIYFFLGVGRS